MLPAWGPRPSVLVTDITLLSPVNLKAPIEAVKETPIANELEYLRGKKGYETGRSCRQVLAEAILTQTDRTRRPSYDVGLA